MMKIVANFNNILLGSWRPATGILRKDRIWYQKGPAGRMLPALGDHVSCCSFCCVSKVFMVKAEFASGILCTD